ncbi:MAG: flagellar protein FlaG [Eubacterium sp.]|nr:flagellar protein FlaG [Eubacterium sp.]
MAISSISSADTNAYQSVSSVKSTPAAEPGKVAATQKSSEEGSKAPEKVTSTNIVNRVQNKEAGQSMFEITERQQESSENNITEVLKKAVEDINKNAGNSEAQFAVHEETNRIMIKIVDKSTKEVIKEFPPEKTLDLIAKAWELAGLTVDERR